MVLDGQVEAPEQEQLAQPVLDFVGGEQAVRRLDTPTELDHLEETGRPVAESSGLMVDVDHLRIEAALEVLFRRHFAPPLRPPPLATRSGRLSGRPLAHAIANPDIGIAGREGPQRA